VTGESPEYRLYHELADWWPVISPRSAYEQDAAAIVAAFDSVGIGVREVLDLGCGGGHVAAYLKDRYSLTLVDLSRAMLAVSGRLNPECEHLPGDMRTVRLGRQFDGVLVHDAVDYVTDVADLRLVVETAFTHCRDGGVAVFAPDHTAETFEAGAFGGGGADAAGRQASFTEQTSDPDPGDGWILAEYEFTLRDADGRARVVRETHRLGSFPRDTWLVSLTRAGFAPTALARTDAGHRRVMFVGRRPAAQV
jgi:SAM-dependent methyltransferase